MSKYENDIDEFITVCKSHSIKKEDCFNLGTICCSEQMIEAGYTHNQALSKAKELINKNEKIESVFREILKMTGYTPED